ncbi:hypothetical protein C8Q76DRAFT_796493 [Earliella scabrosa]|nr:hypothetical protein C8Q76DRAFT_796493 [Earliella scabrosa]
MATVIGIVKTIITGVELATKIGKVAGELIPSPPTDLKDKFRWVQCTVKNETQFDVLLLDTHFDSGRYWTSPGGFGSFSQMAFSACNGDHTFMTGATGGTAFRLSLDDQHYYDFSLGWTAPATGAYKAGVAESGKGVDGYNAADNDGGSIMSKYVFEGKDKDGHPAKFRIHISAAPGQEALFVVKQVPVA